MYLAHIFLTVFKLYCFQYQFCSNLGLTFIKLLLNCKCRFNFSSLLPYRIMWVMGLHTGLCELLDYIQDYVGYRLGCSMSAFSSYHYCAVYFTSFFGYQCFSLIYSSGNWVKLTSNGVKITFFA